MHRRRQYLDAPTHARGTESVAGLGTHTTTCASRCIDVRRGDAVLGLPLAPRSKPVAPPDSADATLAQRGKEILLAELRKGRVCGIRGRYRLTTGSQWEAKHGITAADINAP